jgi:hypothetical protein
VTVFAPCARTPRSVMQECSASSTTPTPGRPPRRFDVDPRLARRVVVDARDMQRGPRRHGWSPPIATQQ